LINGRQMPCLEIPVQAIAYYKKIVDLLSAVFYL